MEKINIAEILKDCPKGMELYSPIFGNVYLDKIRPYLAVVVSTSDKQKEEFLYDGRFGVNGECMLFPSKENRDWSIFQRPFKDGDVCTTIMGTIFIYEKITTYNYCGSYVSFFKGVLHPHYDAYPEDCCRLATEEEKQKLFDAIKANGYKWNPETKTLEKLPKFKVGDRIRDKKVYISGIITDISDGTYKVEYKDEQYCNVSIASQDYWELVPNKFDITTLKPFESRVLVREDKTDVWQPAFYGFFNKKNKRFYTSSSGTWLMCIPYNEGTKHLIGTTDDCDKFYKTWE